MKPIITTTIRKEAGKEPVSTTIITHVPEVIKTVITNQTLISEAGKAPVVNTTIRTKHEGR